MTRIKTDATRTLLIFALLWPAPLLAHGAPDDHLVIHTAGQSLRLNLVVSESVLLRADSDKDGRVTLAELTANRDELERWFATSTQITSTGGEVPVAGFFDITTDLDQLDANDGRVDHARFIRVLLFETAPRDLTIDAGELSSAIPGLALSVRHTASGKLLSVKDPGRPARVILLK